MTAAPPADGYLYLLRDPSRPECVKVGRTVDLDRRIREYPRGSLYLYHVGPMQGVAAMEAAYLRAFDGRFRKEPGTREYFRDGGQRALGAMCELYHRLLRGRCPSHHYPQPMEID
jgi:hypothetical protein